MSEPTSRTLLGAGEFSRALQYLLGTARRQVQIYSQQLARPLYHERETVQLLSEFVRSSRYARLQILIADSEPLLRRPHRLLPLIQRLSTRIELKKLQPAAESKTQEFVLADGIQLLHCEDLEQWRGHHDPENPVRVRQLRDVFEQAWTHARPDPDLRRLLI
ncbi:hypothetical protein [uncultured Microbulbifer sp.]|uniref:DUF7931 domain-containing protein n=1 Tax=uncultured Microbulbifer sp. TaxID=348147 RepID=UPI0025D9CD81|nr:hypothetical protein [uncultured Microbulbifer sp.]